ncbi:MAG: threonylcarbamoyl-AMP synthase [Deltaproteobacteria bacterium RIFCSPLOWO2_02_FULL_44_10]|nr:MAG: threonylcarbamoyl-AMP synthase [Deltaproteobacteria bacterium RIFCSPHIGHO2_02_FULL_44_16]OGQ44997.1 MAG: threonylcarbamoyl-AMP synthase [Deltaproteobacteria bacterium RIFCSPLOWO2_02_FULL_44_10]
MTTILTVDSQQPSEELIEQAVTFLRDGQVIAYPTETIYGLGADVFNEKAVKNIYALKARDVGLPISILISDLAMLRQCASSVSDQALKLARTFWPGALTILFPASKLISKTYVTNTGKVGIRISSHPIASAIVRAFGRPITTTSANPSDYPPSLTAKHVLKYFGNKIPCIIDGGEYEPSRGSTVVDVAEESMRIIREGAIPAEDLIKCFQGK